MSKNREIRKNDNSKRFVNLFLTYKNKICLKSKKAYEQRVRILLGKNEKHCEKQKQDLTR